MQTKMQITIATNVILSIIVIGETERNMSIVRTLII